MIELLQLISGMVIGYCAGSFIESFLHEHVSDAKFTTYRTWLKYPRLCAPMINTYYSHHIIHHLRTWKKDHVTQFSSPIEKARLDDDLLRRGRHGQVIRKGNYATRLYGEGVLVFSLPLILSAVVLAQFLPVIFSIGYLITILIPVFLSWVIHPYLHHPFAEGQRSASPLISALLRTKYCRAMYRQHFMHHRYGGTSNYNLTLGADILRGKMCTYEASDWEEMQRIGLPCN